jgi:non-homologous end joining protein Ku
MKSPCGDQLGWRQPHPIRSGRLKPARREQGLCLRQQLVDEETREPVAPEGKGRGYEIAKGQYLLVEDEELEAIEMRAPK